MFSTLADKIMKHSKAIIAVWIVVLICAVPFILKSNDVLVYDLGSMSGADTEASEGQEIIDDYFSNSVDLSEILVVEYDSADEKTQANAVSAEFTKLMNNEYGEKVTVSNYGAYSKGDVNTTGVLLVAIANNAGDDFDMSHETDEIRDLVSEAKETVGSSLTTYVTGNDAISYDTEESSMSDVARVDPISILLIFVLLALFFYALVTAVVPPVVVGMAYGLTLAGIYAIGSFLGIYYITKTLILVSMLGAGCDYSIFIISRYRDEAKKGKSHEEALRAAVQWGGESVFTSGVSVIIGFAALALCNFSMVQTMGICLAMGILFALIAALTFIPALLNLLKGKIFWPSSIESYRKNEERVAGNGEKLGFQGHLSKGSRRYFAAVARGTRKHAKLIAVVLVIACIPGIYAYANTEDSSDMISIMPDSDSVDGLNLIMDNTDGGTIMPTYIVLDLNENVVTTSGSKDLLGNGTEIPYIVWNETGLDLSTIASSGMPSGTVVDVMTVAKEIQKDYPEIVGTVSGLNSWSVIVYQAAYQAAYEKAVAAGESEDVAKQTAAATGYTLITSPSLDANHAAMMKQINTGIVKELPSAVQTPIQKVIYATSQGTMETTPAAPLGASGLTLSNVIDGILNIGTGSISDKGEYVNMMVITTEKPMSDNTMSFIEDVRADFSDNYNKTYADAWSASYVSGTSAVMNDIMDDVEEQFSFIRIVVAALLIVLLFFILGSYLTPFRAVITILLSVIFTVGITRIVFDGLLDKPVFWLIPIVLFVVLLGLGMDYEIFLTTKIRENKIHGMEDDDAIDDAIRTAGPAFSLCALLMGGTFLSLTLANSTMLQEFGFALGVGILIDGLLMVTYVSPALMHLMGKWSWKGPAFLTTKHGLNPDGSSASAVPAGAVPAAAVAAPGTASTGVTPAYADGGNTVTTEKKQFKQDWYNAVHEKQAEIDELVARRDKLVNAKRINRLDDAGERELAEVKAEISDKRKELAEFQAKKKSEYRDHKD